MSCSCFSCPRSFCSLPSGPQSTPLQDFLICQGRCSAQAPYMFAWVTLPSLKLGVSHWPTGPSPSPGGGTGGDRRDEQQVDHVRQAPPGSEALSLSLSFSLGVSLCRTIILLHIKKIHQLSNYGIIKKTLLAWGALQCSPTHTQIKLYCALTASRTILAAAPSHYQRGFWVAKGILSITVAVLGLARPHVGAACTSVPC